ncbi:lipoyl amidotransferase LIPT1, mitochondrial [Planococcus citri]|uniref:lipoyl amidotransferase LIPT1, mitochondrial n=1 Tax=Planococcus citri TaxID=170843 RepID=UPI0031F82177
MKLPISIIFRKKNYRSKAFLAAFNCIHHQLKYSSYLTKSVFVSESNDIFANLALEDWFYQHYDFTQHQVLLLWRNRNCVVVGRHQNPWLETNLNSNDDLIVARRNSGGGTVYHDMDNLNLTFFTPRDLYDRRHNLEIITNSVKKEWSLDCEVNSRDDIVYEEFKISGTASKLSRKSAYHHCTLLVDANKKRMSAALHNFQKNIITNATRSTPAPILNLRELNPSITIERLMTVVGLQYMRTIPSINTKQIESVKAKGFRFVSPEERYFPGLDEKIENFQSWQWRFGRTPKFTVKASSSMSEIFAKSVSSEQTEIDIDVEAGIVKNISVNVPPSFIPFVTNDELKNVTMSYVERQYSDDLLSIVKEHVFQLFRNKVNDQRLSNVL